MLVAPSITLNSSATSTQSAHSPAKQCYRRAYIHFSVTFNFWLTVILKTMGNNSSFDDLAAAWNPHTPVNHTCFIRRFRRVKKLGDGGDGVVYSWRNICNGGEVAIKTPKDNRLSSVLGIETEIKNLRALGRHELIVGLLAFSDDFQPYSPAIFLQVCDLGDLHNYHKLWFEQQKRLGAPIRIAETTIWKLLHDMIYALNFMHNSHKICFVHNDLKPENILVMTPEYTPPGTVPNLPIFKITDFARLSMYPTLDGHTAKEWRGTYEYGPPRSERTSPMSPAVDMWGLGATIQTFALDMWPLQTRQAFIDSRAKNGLKHPLLDDSKAWNDSHWRARLPVVYRPLDVPRDVMRTDWDVEQSLIRHHEPYSDYLNTCYKTLLDEDPKARATSAHLMTYLVPWIAQDLVRKKELELAKMRLERASRLRNEVEMQKAVQGDSVDCLAELTGKVENLDLS
jgi:serine/threonine protein kinase